MRNAEGTCQDQPSGHLEILGTNVDPRTAYAVIGNRRLLPPPDGAPPPNSPSNVSKH